MQQIMFQYISCCYLSCQIQFLTQTELMFQYISCCYLSNITLRNRRRTLSFNTSHVVIYHTTSRLRQEKILRFQYISCCYLSFYAKSQAVVPSRFQYISCCYLSKAFSVIPRITSPFQYISCCYLSEVGENESIRKRVSIHLMLLFIPSSNFLL